jgi:DNA-binding response OmpR family regulator
MAHILVVDDEISMTTLLTVALERQGHTVLSASNGVHALEVLPDDGVHLVVTDINMPQMDGFELISVLIEKFPGQKVLAISGAGGDGLQGDLHTARELGATRCMDKPFEISEFYDNVDALLSEREEELV